MSIFFIFLLQNYLLIKLQNLQEVTYICSLHNARRRNFDLRNIPSCSNIRPIDQSFQIDFNNYGEWEKKIISKFQIGDIQLQFY